MNERFLKNYEDIRSLKIKFNMLQAENEHLLEDITVKGQTVLDRIDDFQRIQADKKFLLDEILNIIDCDISYEISKELTWGDDVENV